MQITVENMSKKINRIMILEQINMVLESGNIYGLNGKNGSGKTMLLRCLCGLIKVSKGAIFIDGVKLGEDIDFPPSIGVLIENPAFLNGYTGFQNLKMLASLNGKVSDEEIRKTLNMVGLDSYDKRKYRKYSLGMKQKLGIACAVMGEPNLIILDEPTNALDSEGMKLFRNLLLQLKQKGKLIVIASHNEQELELLSDMIYIIEDGKCMEREKA